MKETVDFAAVMKNAAAEGIDLQCIAICYEDLSPEELTALEKGQEITHDLGNGKVLAKFPEDNSTPLLPEKATGVMYLGA